MPELPEIETIVRGLSETLIDNTINDIRVSNKKLRLDYPQDFYEQLYKQKIIDIKRRSKYIQIFLTNNMVIIIHLGMSGKLVIANYQNKLFTDKHSHAVFDLDNDNYLIFNDPRRFGLITTCHKNDLENHKLFKNLGIEPLTTQFNTHYLYQLLYNKKSNIKQFIMNAANIVGVGNIYASEVLFKAKIHPLTIAHNINKTNSIILVKYIKEVLLAAIDSGGSSLKNYRNSNDELGYFQHNFFVYNRKSQSCFICNTSIEKIIISARSSFFCPSCQVHYT